MCKSVTCAASDCARGLLPVSCRLSAKRGLLLSFLAPFRLWADDSGSATMARAAVVACSGRDASLSLQLHARGGCEWDKRTNFDNCTNIFPFHMARALFFFFYCLVCFFLRVFFVSLCYDVGCMYIATCNARHDRQKWGMMASCSARLVPVMWKGVWSTPRTEGKDASSEGRTEQPTTRPPHFFFIFFFLNSERFTISVFHKTTWQVAAKQRKMDIKKRGLQMH